MINIFIFKFWWYILIILFKVRVIEIVLGISNCWLWKLVKEGIFINTLKLITACILFIWWLSLIIFKFVFTFLIYSVILIILILIILIIILLHDNFYYTNYLIKPNWRWYVSDSPIRDLFIKIYGDYISPSLKNDIIAKQIIDETLENINRFKAFL